MPEVWGLLPKSQIDDETIEEAIARLILAHCNDETAHLGVGQALQSHKASVIIDHLVDSIIEDKIRDRGITVMKLLRDRQVIQPSFESLDAWGQIKEGATPSIEITPGACKLTTGGADGNKTEIYIEGMIRTVAKENDPWFQATIDFASAPQDQHVMVGVGDVDMWTATNFFGFRWDADLEKMYTIYVKGGVETKFEIAGYDENGANIVRAEMTNGGNTLEFYVNDVLVKTYTSLALSLDSDYYFAFANKVPMGGAGEEANISDVIFCQKW